METAKSLTCTIAVTRILRRPRFGEGNNAPCFPWRNENKQRSEVRNYVGVVRYRLHAFYKTMRIVSEFTTVQISRNSSFTMQPHDSINHQNGSETQCERIHEANQIQEEWKKPRASWLHDIYKVPQFAKEIMPLTLPTQTIVLRQDSVHRVCSHNLQRFRIFETNVQSLVWI